MVLAPAAIAALASPAGRMPLSLRLAMRDAARHRHRTGPATSAIAVAVAGSVVLAFLSVGNLRAEELRYVPALPPHVLSVEPGRRRSTRDGERRERAAADCPAARRTSCASRCARRPGIGTSEAYLRQLYLTPDPRRLRARAAGAARPRAPAATR